MKDLFARSMTKFFRFMADTFLLNDMDTEQSY